MASLGNIHYTAINAGTDGDNEVVAAVTGKKIRVHAFFLVVDVAGTVRFESSAGGTALTGAMPFAANGGISVPYNDNGWFETVAGENLNLELAAGTDADGAVVWSLV